MTTIQNISDLQPAQTTLQTKQSTSNNTDVSFDKVLNLTQKPVEIQTGNATLDSIFEKASKTYGVDCNLLKAVAKQESNFTSNATSSSGAMGIMQLMPATAKSLGVTHPYDAEENIMGGAKLLASHLKKYNGDVSLALAAYNAGSNAVDKYNGVPPYSETQQYVKNILASMNSNIAVPQYANTANTSAPTAPVLTKEQIAAIKREAKLNKQLADIPNEDLYLTSTEETDMISDQTSAVAASSSTDTDSQNNSSDYKQFAENYIKLLANSSLSTSGLSTTTTDSTNALNALSNLYSSTSNSYGYSNAILQLLQGSLSDDDNSNV